MALLPLLLVAVLIAAVAAGTAALRRSGPSRETTVAGARRHAAATVLLALVAGLVAAGWAAVQGGDLGGGGTGSGSRAVMLAPIAFGVVHTLVLTLGELTWPRPAGQLRRARLVHRGPLDAAPRWLVRATGAAVATAAVTVLLGCALGSEHGRRFTYQGRTPQGLVESVGGPFPGTFYGIPAATGLLVLAVASAGALRVVATRAAVVTTDARVEETLRRASAHRVLRVAAGVPLAVSGGLLFFAGHAVRTAAQGVALNGGAGPGLVGTAGGVVWALGALIGLAGLVVLCVPAPGVPADEPVAA